MVLRTFCGSKRSTGRYRDDEVLVKIHATTVTRTDCAFRRAKPFVFYRFITGLRRPKRRILGSELAGEIEGVGAAVSEFAVGDHVFGSSELRFGAHAEFICLPESALLATKPAGMRFEEAVAVCDGALKALDAIRRADLHEGQQILVYGASGAIGTAGVQLARYFGAEVTAVCATKNVALVGSLGADRVIDYTQEDFTKNDQTWCCSLSPLGIRRTTSCSSRTSSKRAGTRRSSIGATRWSKSSRRPAMSRRGRRPETSC
jgi:NADPH:quinone reductase-like Zn-dependent oxidoreductase